ncbi:MAG: PQQ-binding-like beta-propeller repeat protein, partial [bacterium]
MKVEKSLPIILLVIVFRRGPAHFDTAEDWPMWRYDPGHTSCSPEELAKELNLQWVLELPVPKSCWPFTQFRMLFDLSYEPIVMGNRLFVPSMVRDSVTAYDTETGEKQWCFYADGPVRFAPVGWNGKIYFISDDSHLYCLDAEKGTLLWKFRGGPSDYKVLGNERLISMWPARGGPVLYDGTIYFAASIWPFMGTFIHALDAETGQVVWTNGGSGSDFILQPHASPAFAGVGPQGYLAATEDKLLVASGRSVPAVYDRQTGKFLYFQTVTKNGSCEILVGKDWFVNEEIMYNLDDGERFANSNASIVSGDTMIGIDEEGRIRASLLDPVWTEYVDRRGEKQKRPEFPTLWETQQPIKEIFIRAGSRLYCGAPGLVAAVNIPSASGEPSSISWQSRIEGNPWSMLAANGRLFVVTKEGRIYCFGERQTRTRIYKLETQALEAPRVSNDSVSSAQGILEKTGVREGYCLVLGLENGQLLEGLLRNSNLHIIGLDSDADRVESLRRKFD